MIGYKVVVERSGGGEWVSPCFWEVYRKGLLVRAKFCRRVNGEFKHHAQCDRARNCSGTLKAAKSVRPCAAGINIYLNLQDARGVCHSGWRVMRVEYFKRDILATLTARQADGSSPIRRVRKVKVLGLVRA